MDTIWFFAGAAIFLAAVALAWRRWWSRLPGIAPAARLTLIATTIGGLVGAFFWWQDVDASFAWNLPPLASRMLGAAATAFGLAGLYVLERPRPARARLQALMTVVYLVPLVIAILLFHLDRFDFSVPIAWGFFAIVALLSLAALAALRIGGHVSADGPTGGPESVWLLAAGVLLGIWGLALFAAPATAVPLVFPWASDPLTSRLIAAMLMTVSTVFLAARRDRTLRVQAHVVGAVYGLGVTAAILVNVVRGLPWPTLYFAAFAILGLVSAGILIATRRSQKA